MSSSSMPDPLGDDAKKLALDEVEEVEAILEQRPPRSEEALGEGRDAGRGSGWVTAALAAPGLIWIGFYLLAPLTMVVTVLLVGLTGSGKSRIAYALERRLWDEGRAVTVLYGQNMRHGLNRDLGFTADDRSENLRRSAEVAKLMNDAGVITVAAFVAPHEAVREKAKSLIGRDRVLEVYCTAPMDVLRARDQSGAYKLADEGKIAQMPGERDEIEIHRQ